MRLLSSAMALAPLCYIAFAAPLIEENNENRAIKGSPISQDGLFTEYAPTLVSDKLSGLFAQSSVRAKGTINSFLKDDKHAEVAMVLLGKTGENKSDHTTFIEENADEDFEHKKEEEIGINDWLLRQYEKVRRVNQTSNRQNMTATSINNELLGSFDFNSGCVSDMMQIEARRADSSLEWFIARLKSFMTETVFDYNAFETNGDQLEQFLAESAEHIKVIAPCDQNLTLKYNFAKRIFDVMSNSIEILRYYSTVTGVGHHILHLIVDLNVNVLKLFNSLGIPDPTIDGFAEKVAANILYLIQCEADFKKQGATSYSKHLVFRKWWNQARKTLQILAFTIPGEESAFEQQNFYVLGKQKPETVVDPAELAKMSPFSVTA